MILHLPWQGREVPCAILDILRGCNARCAYCFNQEQPFRQSLSEVEHDLDALMARRRLQAIMISGGEPTLHPELLPIIRLAAARNLKVILLTNGILLDAALAAALREAGCSLCFLHIQCEQQRPDLADPDNADAVAALRAAKGKLLREAGIPAGYIVTLRPGEADGFDAELSRYLEQELFTHLLLTTAKSATDFDGRHPMADVDIEALAGRFRRRGFVPFAVLCGKIDRKQPRWFSFQVVESIGRDGTLRRRISLRGSLGEWAFMRLRRLLLGHYDFFLGRQSSAFLRLRLLVNGLTGGEIAAAGLALTSWRRGETLRFRNMALETPPYRRDDGRLEYCCDCPGAVFRNGRLKPLCLTDIEMLESD